MWRQFRLHFFKIISKKWALREVERWVVFTSQHLLQCYVYFYSGTRLVVLLHRRNGDVSTYMPTFSNIESKLKPKKALQTSTAQGRKTATRWGERRSITATLRCHWRFLAMLCCASRNEIGRHLDGSLIIKALLEIGIVAFYFQVMKEYLRNVNRINIARLSYKLAIETAISQINLRSFWAIFDAFIVYFQKKSSPITSIWFDTVHA